MDPIENKIADFFAAFEREQDPDVLYNALNEVEDVPRHAELSDRDACKRGLSLLLSYLAAVDQHIDPKWDEDDVPVKGVHPTFPGLEAYGNSQVDPATITDPAIRAGYEQALEANSEKRKRYRAQFQLRRLEEQAMRHLNLFAERCFTGSSNDRQEFHAIVENSSVSDTRRKSVRKMVR